MDKDTEKVLLYGGLAVAAYFLFIKKPATTPVITTSSTGAPALNSGSNLLATATTPLTTLASSLQKLLNPTPAPPAGGTQGASAVQLQAIDPASQTLAPQTTQQLITQVDTGNPFGSPGALVVPGLANTGVPVATTPVYAYQPDYSGLLGDGSDAYMNTNFLEETFV